MKIPPVWVVGLELAGVGLALGQRGLRLVKDLADLLDAESTDLMLLATLEYDLVLGLVSLIVVSGDDMMVFVRGLEVGVQLGGGVTPK